MRLPLLSTPPKTIEMSPYTVAVKIHARARRVTLRYDAAKGQFTLTRPKRFSARAIDEFLHTHRDWMTRQAQNAAPTQIVQPGQVIPVEGVPRLLVHADASGVAVTLTETELRVACRPARFNRAVRRFLQQRAAAIMTPLTHAKAARIGKTVTAISYRDPKSRWGSCATGGRLSFSWRLVMAPPEVIDYLVAHEVAHLQHMDHSKKFWALCFDLTPHYTMAKHWLHQHGAALHVIHF